MTLSKYKAITKKIISKKISHVMYRPVRKIMSARKK